MSEFDNHDLLGNIYLVGPMGSGKSTVGKRLAQVLEYEFVDSDREIEQKTGVSINHIFDVEGEVGFRKREESAIRTLTKKTGFVLATGGGSILSAENRHLLNNTGLVIYLKTSVEAILERTSRDKCRPLLQTENPRKTLQNLMQQRESLYQQVAHYTIETDNKNATTVADEIVDSIGKTN